MKIAIIGAGNMGAAIAESLNDEAFMDATIVLANPHEGKLEKYRAGYDLIEVTTDNREAVEGADVVILAVKPWVLPTVIDQIKGCLDYDRRIVVSLAGGVSLDRLDEMLARTNSASLPVTYRVIPNTAIAVGRGLTFISGRRTSADTDALLTDMFGTMGCAAIVEERLMDAGTALASCGIAYVYKFIQAMTQAGVELGFRPAEALDYSTMTVAGAAAMLSAGDTTPQREIDRVTTPGGMTIRGINELDHCGFTSAVINAIIKPLKK